ncbi:sensor histidine kinase [Actinoallomurus acaciae]|uniref:histidine kinase n=1 Tax=Actinoallomurus acaciae TaxID=502577 RepID=A0ABV5YTS9_9ACTN
MIRHLRGLWRSLNAAARALPVGCGEVRRLAEEWGALRHVATLVARGASPSVIFNAAAAELGALLDADYTAIKRYETDHTESVVTLWRAPGSSPVKIPFGGRWPVEDDAASAAVWRSHRPAQMTSESFDDQLAAWLQEQRIGRVVVCPVISGDRLWGTMNALYLGSEPLPGDTEERMDKFVELLSCAIAQAETRTELVASRARLVTTAEATRRRIERDLHDGPQQHLISLSLRLREAEAELPRDQREARRHLSDTVQDLSAALAELQEIARGLRPPLLARRGLKAALKGLVARSPVPVELHVDADGRLPEQLEVSLYYIVSEALTNVFKHAHASVVHIDLTEEDAKIRLRVRDDGVGGADPSGGSGLTGLTDRVEALGGTMHVTSPTGRGTSLVVTVPTSRAGG